MNTKKDNQDWSSVSFAGNRRQQTIEFAESTTPYQRLAWVCEASEVQRTLGFQSEGRTVGLDPSESVVRSLRSR